MVNFYAIGQLISGIIFGTLSLVSLINAMVSWAMCAIIGMALAEFTISYIEKNRGNRNKNTK